MEIVETMKLLMSLMLYIAIMAGLCYGCVRGFESGCLGALPLIFIIGVILYFALRLIVNIDDPNRTWSIVALIIAAVAAFVPLGIRIMERIRERPIKTGKKVRQK